MTEERGLGNFERMVAETKIREKEMDAARMIVEEEIAAGMLPTPKTLGEAFDQMVQVLPSLGTERT